MTIAPHWEFDGDHHVTWWHACTGHPGFDEVPCGIPLGGNGWTLVSKEPLTISPSLLCRGCGTHGFITNGQWVPA